jgi:hypothetical protein
MLSRLVSRRCCVLSCAALLTSVGVIYVHFLQAFRYSHICCETSASVFCFPHARLCANNATKNDTAALLTDDLTVVTAYFNIGTFDKGSVHRKFSPDMYHRWMKVFANIDNPLFVFVDTNETEAIFRHIRSSRNSNMTVINLLRTNSLWSFKIKSNISDIYRQPGYPVHRPNTVLPAYSSAMHAKYKVMEMAILTNPFRTKYFCWLDIGLFRDISNSNQTIRLYLPERFQNDSVAYTKVNERKSKLTVKEIVYGNHVWVCGCFFVAESNVMLGWIQEYKNATERMLQQRLMSTDQQVIYYAFNHMSPRTKLQLYTSDGRYNEWFHLGYMSRKMPGSKERCEEC